MLTRNVDVSDGLVNGSIGTIYAYKTTPRERVYIKFDRDEAGAKQRSKTEGLGNTFIERCEEKLHRYKAVTRRQFPLKLAFACTIHKVQGMTCRNAVVSLDRVFSPGMAYVTLSRSTTLNGLSVVKFNEKNMY